MEAAPSAEDLVVDGRGRESQVSIPTNGQLPTPSLSPHGSPAFNAVTGETWGSMGHLNGGASDEEDAEVDKLRLGEAGNAVSVFSPTSRSSNISQTTVSSPPLVGEVLKLSPAKITELTSSPESLPIRVATPLLEDQELQSAPLAPRFDVGKDREDAKENKEIAANGEGEHSKDMYHNGRHNGLHLLSKEHGLRDHGKDMQSVTTAMQVASEPKNARPCVPTRTLLTPPNIRRKSASKTHRTLQVAVQGKVGRQSPPPLNLKDSRNLSAHNTLSKSGKQLSAWHELPSPMPTDIPLPPMSIATYLDLELSAERPSPLYIHRSIASENPYESSEVKLERLMNFLRLAPELERVLAFGTLACTDSFLYTFTILPLRFVKAVSLLVQWIFQNLAREIRDVGLFIYRGFPRVLTRRRGRRRGASIPRKELEKLQQSRASSTEAGNGNVNSRCQSRALDASHIETPRKRSHNSATRHHRARSSVSALRASHKADLLKGLLITLSCAVLMRFDASRMYHSIRGQAAIKLYVVYNVLEVADRLLSAIGQDVLECLFSDSVLERDGHGRSKLARPFFMFLLALVYNVAHSTALFYHVITLNVAVNSYSNALLTLLMSNQFVEIKGTVWKKFEKENLFQITCADIVERFQLLLMLSIIALRNIAEVGSLSISLSTMLGSSSTTGSASNAANAPQMTASVIPKAFTVLPSWTGEVLGPFLIVLGSEMFVDWLKHAFINKFNNTKPNMYGRFLDVIAKDYYTHAFAEQNLNKRLGLPVLPLACLFIRTVTHTYHMFLAAHMPLPIPSSATSISLESATPSATSALAHVDKMFRRALGRSSFGAGVSDSSTGFSWWDTDDLIALGAMIAFFGVCYIFLLAGKLVLGMVLLRFARRRYKTMKEREREIIETEGRRVGGWGVVEVDEEKRRWIYKDDEKGLLKIRERDEKARRAAREGAMPDLSNVDRYQMVGKRIW